MISKADTPNFLCVDVGGAKSMNNKNGLWMVLDIRTKKEGVIFYDIREMKPLPFENETVDFYYNSQVLPYLTPNEIIFILEEIYRTLKPGGILRISVPDIKVGIDLYLNKPKELDRSIYPHSYSEYHNKTALGRLSSWFYSRGIGVPSLISAFDDETLILYLKEAGFTDIRKSSYRDYIHPVFEEKDTPRYGSWALYYYVYK